LPHFSGFFFSLLHSAPDFPFFLWKCCTAFAAEKSPLGLFCAGVTDPSTGQPIDTRTRTGWNISFVDLDPIETLELSTINEVAPFTIARELLQTSLTRKLFCFFAFLCASFHGESLLIFVFVLFCSVWKYAVGYAAVDNVRMVINVLQSAGYPKRQQNLNASLAASGETPPHPTILPQSQYECIHPHADMTLSALRTLTLKLSLLSRQHRLSVLCVDAGWASDKRPFVPVRDVSVEREPTSGFKPPKPLTLPLSAEDGAARVMAAVFNCIGHISKKPVTYNPYFTEYGVTIDVGATGVLFRHFEEVPWPFSDSF
jgi:hypothetical protein